MGRFLIVSKAEQLMEYKEIAETYNMGFEINDFYDPQVLDSEEEQERLIRLYQDLPLPQESTMHGAFYDVIVFSCDKKIRNISTMRMAKSMEIARRLGVSGVVFHTNHNPVLDALEYDENVIYSTVKYVGRLLEEYPEINIYLENMFDSDPEILFQISERLCQFKNYGVCLDYAHAAISKTEPKVWMEKLSPYIRHMHINDNDLERDLHLAIGSGKIDWSQFYENYCKCFKDCSVLIETTTPQWQKQSISFLLEHYSDLIKND